MGNEDLWDDARFRATQVVEKARVTPMPGAIAGEHQPYFMYALERHQFPAGYRNTHGRPTPP